MVARKRKRREHPLCFCCHTGQPCPCCALHNEISEDKKRKLANEFARSYCCGVEAYESDGTTPLCDQCAWIAIGWYNATWPTEAA